MTVDVDDLTGGVNDDKGVLDYRWSCSDQRGFLA